LDSWVACDESCQPDGCHDEGVRAEVLALDPCCDEVHGFLSVAECSPGADDD
jgi:hypothetical protein